MLLVGSSVTALRDLTALFAKCFLLITETRGHEIDEAYIHM
jgi:hypothetical protein